MRKYDLNDIHLSVEEWHPYSNEKYEGLTITWYSDIGFGEYTIYRESGSDKWYADSEGMDSNNDKSFLNKLLELMAAKTIIDG